MALRSFLISLYREAICLQYLHPRIREWVWPLEHMNMTTFTGFAQNCNIGHLVALYRSVALSTGAIPSIAVLHTEQLVQSVVFPYRKDSRSPSHLKSMRFITEGFSLVLDLTVLSHSSPVPLVYLYQLQDEILLTSLNAQLCYGTNELLYLLPLVLS